MTNRRGFIGALIGATVLDPERLLWKPGKLFSIPKATWRESGLDIRLISFYNHETNRFQSRFDAIYGDKWIGAYTEDAATPKETVEAWFRQDWERSGLPKLGRVVEVVDPWNSSPGLNWPCMRIQ